MTPHKNNNKIVQEKKNINIDRNPPLYFLQTDPVRK